MKNVNAEQRCLLLTAVVITPVSVSSVSAGAESWKDTAVLICPKGDQAVVRS